MKLQKEGVTVISKMKGHINIDININPYKYVYDVVQQTYLSKFLVVL